jgi:hypothetical protein
LRHTAENEKPVTGLFQAIGNGSVLEPPFADEGFATRFDPFANQDDRRFTPCTT